MTFDRSTHIYDRHGKTIRRSKNLRGLLDHYHAKPDDLVVKVVESVVEPIYCVTVCWPRSGDEGHTYFADWRVLLGWLSNRRSWSIKRVTFDAPLYDKIFASPCAELLQEFRETGVPLTRHAYRS